MWLMCKWTKQRIYIYFFFLFNKGLILTHKVSGILLLCSGAPRADLNKKNIGIDILYFWKGTVIHPKILNLIQNSRLEELSEGHKGYYNTNAISCNIFRFVMKLLVKSAAKGEQRPINEYRGHASILWGHMSMI